MSTDVIQNTNQLVAATKPILDFYRSKDFKQACLETEVDWDSNTVLRYHPALGHLLLEMNFSERLSDGSLSLGMRGRVFLGKILLNIDEQLKLGLKINDRYELRTLLAAGKNSLAFKAEDLRLGRCVVLKFFRPGRGEGIVANIARIGGIKGEPVLVNPIDVFKHVIQDSHGRSVSIDVLIFPYVEGMTLREYLVTEKNSSPVVIEAFIEQTCIALCALHKAGLSHGDLHPNNVLVTTESSGRIGFRIIDVSYGADEPSDYEIPASDMDGFKFILRLALEDIQLKLKRISLRRHLGARIFTLVEYILKSENLSFEDVYNELIKAARFTEFNERKDQFLRTKFKKPRDFGILRYEEFSNPNVAIKLFCPYPELFERLCSFGSTTLFGHRGTGKSTYMAAMNFFPHADSMPVDYRESFGILFSCRQGEFRKFSSKHLRQITPEIQLQIKDILITKIIRKTLGSLAEGIAKEKLRQPKTVKAIADVVLSRVQHTPGIMQSHQLSEVASLKATVLHAEINLIDGLFAGAPLHAQSKLLDEHSLCEFFEAVRSSFSELNQTRFSVLFDDAGVPNVPHEVQLIICDLMASTNSIFCVKLSAEKRTFNFVTSEKKPIERVHDMRVYTISDYFSLGGGFSNEKKEVEAYFRKLVAKRLDVCRFQSEDIREYLGEEVMSADELVKRLVSRNHSVPVYGGWQIIWQLADRTMRHLIEMISAIFDESKTTPDKKPSIISRHVQSRQIVRFSHDKLRNLMFLPGTIKVDGRQRPLGKMLYEFAASFGKVSRYYLQSSSNSEDDSNASPRYDERLAIEIDNTLELCNDAAKMLDALIRFAVIDDEKMATALDDDIRKPIYVFNRVYCPVLRISFRRADHWRLSSKRFEQFLLTPGDFVKTDQRLSKLLLPHRNNEGDLFE